MESLSSSDVLRDGGPGVLVNVGPYCVMAPALALALPRPILSSARRHPVRASSSCGADSSRKA
jgi:hypothetical protein